MFIRSSELGELIRVSFAGRELQAPARVQGRPCRACSVLLREDTRDSTQGVRAVFVWARSCLCRDTVSRAPVQSAWADQRAALTAEVVPALLPAPHAVPALPGAVLGVSGAGRRPRLLNTGTCPSRGDLGRGFHVVSAAALGRGTQTCDLLRLDTVPTPGTFLRFHPESTYSEPT